MNSPDSPRAARAFSLHWIFIAVLAVYTIALFASLGRFAFIGPDEPRYAQIAREMFQTGDYVSPRLGGLLWLEKPALLYWLAALSYHVFGANEFAARVPSALAALTTIGLLWFVPARLGYVRLGKMSALVLATGAMWLGFSRAATTDTLLAASMCFAILSAFLSTTTEGKIRLRYLLLGAAFTGVAMLAKGLVAVLLVGAILTLHCLATRRILFRSWKEPLLATLVFVLVAGLWYVPVTLRLGDLFIQEFIINQHFKRYLTNKYMHPQPPYFYGIVSLAGALPWGFFLFPALAQARFLRPRENARDSFLALAWIGFLVPVAFFSLSGSKLPGYILPSFPFLAIILASQAERLWNGDTSRALRIAAALNAFTLMLIGAAGEWYLRKKGLSLPGGVIALAAPLLLGIAALVALAMGKVRGAIAAPVAAVLCFVVAAVAMLPAISAGMGKKEFALEVVSKLKPEEDIVYYKLKKQYTDMFYSNGRVAFYKNGRIIETISGGDDLDIENRRQLKAALKTELLEDEPSVVLVTQTKWESHFLANPIFVARIIAQRGDSIAYRVALRGVR